MAKCKVKCYDCGEEVMFWYRGGDNQFRCRFCMMEYEEKKKREIAAKSPN